MKYTPRVLICYAWDDYNQKGWIEKFARDLRKNGIDTRIDQWELQYGDDLAEWMETSIRESDFVLFICTPTYKEKADSRKGGVGFETLIATAEVLEKKQEVQRKYIPVLRFGDWESAAPSWLLGKYRVDLREGLSAKDYGNLILTLTGRLTKIPSLGSPDRP